MIHNKDKNHESYEFKFYENDIQIKWDRAIQLLQTDDFIDYFCKAIRQDHQWNGYFFEASPINYDRNFECVLIKRIDEFQKADLVSFRDQMTKCKDDSIVVFENISNRNDNEGDVNLLISPCKNNRTDNDIYGHIAAFLKGGPKIQIRNLWKSVAQVIHEQYKKDKQLFLSTDGRGVPWLHIRLETYPKHAKHKGYTKEICNRPLLGKSKQTFFETAIYPKSGL